MALLFLNNKKLLIFGLSLAIGLLPHLVFAQNEPPVAYDCSISTKTSVEIDLSGCASDPEGDPLTFYIVSYPTHGEFSCPPPPLFPVFTCECTTTSPTYPIYAKTWPCGDLWHVYYVPTGEPPYWDEFTFQVEDDKGEKSREATFKIKVEKGLPWEECKPFDVGCILWEIGEYVLTLPVRIIFALPTLLAGLIGLLASAFFSATVALVNWAITYFPQIGITPAAGCAPGGPTPKIVCVGWTFSRDFVNMLFILILAFIGLATILKLETYGIKKTLPLLLIIALLVNFSSVIVGLIVDIGNILTHFFFDKVETLAGFNVQADFLSSALPALFTSEPDLDYFTGIMSQSVVSAIFYGLAALVYLAIFLLLFFRIIILWVLAILAPFAFACYILPATRRGWEVWLQQLILWSIVGVPLGLFMYFAAYLQKSSIETFTQPAIGGSMGGLLASMMNPLLSLAMLGLGVLIAIQLAPAGATQIISLGRKVGTKYLPRAGKFIGAQTLGRILATEKGRKAMEWLTRRELGLKWEGVSKKRKALTLVAAPALLPVRYGLRRLGRAGLEYGAAQAAIIEQEVENLKRKFGQDVDRAAATYTATPPLRLGWREKIATGLYLARTKGGEGLKKLTEAQIREVINLTIRYAPGKLMDIIKHSPQLIDDAVVGEKIKNALIPAGPEDEDVKKLIKIGFSEAKAIRKAAFKKVVEALKEKEIDLLTKKTIFHDEFIEATARFKPSPRFVQKLSEKGGIEFIEKLNKKLRELGGEEIAKTNLPFLRATITNLGLRAIISPIPGAKSREEIKILEKIVREPILLEYNQILRKIEEAKSAIQRLEREKTPGAKIARAKRIRERQIWERRISELKREIDSRPKLKEIWEEIEKLKKRKKPSPREMGIV